MQRSGINESVSRFGAAPASDGTVAQEGDRAAARDGAATGAAGVGQGGAGQAEAASPLAGVGSVPGRAGDADNNEALWLKDRSGTLATGGAPMPVPAAHEIVVRNRAVAINPFDWVVQSFSGLVTPWLRFPCILGTDVAGEVVAAGAQAQFKPGDRVLGHALGLEKMQNRPAEGGFQRYSVIQGGMASIIPDTLSFEEAAVLPLGLSTAASALFEADQLGLALPGREMPRRGETVLIWGGATSVGCNAIQLAVAAGYAVVTTASPRNAEMLLSLGAQAVFDYASPTVVADILRACEGQTLAGAVAIGAGSARPCLDILRQCRGRKIMAVVSPPVALNNAPEGWRRRFWLVPVLARMVGGNVSLAVRARAARVRSKFVWGSALAKSAVGPAIYADFLPRALAEGRYRAMPPAQVVGHGLDAIPAAMRMHKRGVSARKIVVTL